MYEALKAIHLLSLGMLAIAVANSIVGALMARAETAARPILVNLTQIFGRIGRVGLLLLWVTGVWMFVDRYGGDFGAVDTAFHVKLALVVIMTAIVLVMDYSPLRYRAGVVPILGIASALGAILIVVFAAIAFN